MWDAAQVARVRDRKLNEILVFASMAKIDSERIDQYIDIIVSLGDDIDACDTLLETDGQAEICLEPITDTIYTDRLSQLEYADEEAFNAMKSEPAIEPDVMGIDVDTIKVMIGKAVDSIISQRNTDNDCLRDAYYSICEELSEAKKVIEELKASSQVAEMVQPVGPDDSSLEKIRELEERNEGLLEDNERLRTELGSCEGRIRQFEESIVPELQSQNSSLKTKVTALENDFSALSQQNGSLISENARITDLEEKNRALELKISEYSRMNDELRMVNERLDSDLAGTSALKEAVSSLKEELRVLRDRNEQLSSELDYAKESVATAENERDEAIRLSQECPPISESPSEDTIEADEDIAVESEKKAVVDRILSDSEIESLRKILDMKNSKIDEFIDMSLQRRINDNVCDDVVNFLKLDTDICRMLIGIDYSDFDSIVSGFRSLLDLLESAPEAKFQKRYRSTLDPQQAELEMTFVAIVNKIHDVIQSRYLRFVTRTSS